VRQVQRPCRNSCLRSLLTGQADTYPRIRKRPTSDPFAHRVTSHGYRSPIAWDLRVAGRLEPQPADEKSRLIRDRAYLVGITNADVAASTAAAIKREPGGYIIRGKQEHPDCVASGRQDRARLSQIENLYINSSQDNVKVPYASVATLKDILRRRGFGVENTFAPYPSCAFRRPGVLASEVLAPIEPKLNALRKSLHQAINYRSAGKRQGKLTDSRSRGRSFLIFSGRIST